MDFSLQSTKDYYIDLIKNVKEYSDRKMNNQFPELVAYVKSITQPEDFGERLYILLHGEGKCMREGCTNIPKFRNYREGYTHTCGYKCNRALNPQGATSPAAKQVIAKRMEALRQDVQRMIKAGEAFCIYCNGTAKFYSEQHRTWRCTKRPQDCPVAGPKRGKEISLKLTGLTRDMTATKIEEVAGQLCCYGCGEVARFRMTESCGSKLCCSVSHQACASQRLKRKSFMSMKYQDPQVKALFISRLNESLKEAYGVSWMMQIPGIAAKRAKLSEERWGPGMYHVNVRPGYKEKNEERLEQLAKNLAKDYVLPSGRVIKVRGYEDMALDDLLSLFEETEISSDLDLDRQTPRIDYQIDGKPHFYRPDFWIKPINTIIEVKSVYTYKDVNKHCFVRNKLKEAAALKAGYEFLWMIYSDRKTKILLSEAERLELDAAMLG